MTQVCDYLVIGAGSAGCVLANRLSEDPAIRVILVEAGGSDALTLNRVPGMLYQTVTRPRTNWGYQTEPQAQMQGRRMPWARGKVLGGSSAINGMLYVRGNPRDYDNWRQKGCTGWSFADVLPFFKRAEANERGETDLHGGDGPLNVLKGTSTHEIGDAFIAAAAEAGFPVIDDFNGATQEGFGHYDMTIRKARRWGTASAYLAPARDRPNLTVISQAMATRILVEGGAAVGAELLVAGQKQVVRAEREVLLSGGAINSPQLLMLSGIGPADHLMRHGITVQHDAPEVGENLQDHLAYRIRLRCPLPVTAYRYRNPIHAAQVGAEYALFRTGFLASSPMPAGGFFRTDERLEVPDMQVHIVLALMTDTPSRLPEEHGFMVQVNQGVPASRGTIRLHSADPLAHPAIDPRYLSVEDDLRTLVAGVRQMQEVVHRKALSRYVTEEVEPGLGASEEAIADLIRRKAVTVYHPVGTCRMGNDPGAVVDPELRVNGVARLRVVDASVMPVIMNGNTNAPTIMIAEKAAGLIRAAG